MVRQQGATSESGARVRPVTRNEGNVVTRFFAAISRFIAQIFDELRKVVRPTREELVTYTTVVLVFVAVIMMLVLGLDTAFRALVAWALGAH